MKLREVLLPLIFTLILRKLIRYLYESLNKPKTLLYYNKYFGVTAYFFYNRIKEYSLIISMTYKFNLKYNFKI